MPKKPSSICIDSTYILQSKEAICPSYASDTSDAQSDASHRGCNEIARTFRSTSGRFGLAINSHKDSHDSIQDTRDLVRVIRELVNRFDRLDGLKTTTTLTSKLQREKIPARFFLEFVNKRIIDLTIRAKIQISAAEGSRIPFFISCVIYLHL